VSIGAGSGGSAGVEAGDLAGAGESCRGLAAMLATAWSGAGEPDTPAADTFADAGEARLNLAFHRPNVTGTSRNFQCTNGPPRRPSYGGVMRRVQQERGRMSASVWNRQQGYSDNPARRNAAA